MSAITYKAASVQFEPTMFAKDGNIEQLLELVGQAADEGSRLIVTPEMGITGYCWFDRAEVQPFVETVPGKTTDRFGEIARRYDCYIVIGLPEVDPDTNLYYNTAVLIGPKGVIGKHRKTHPYISEPKWSAPGNLGHQVFDTPLGRIALLICMDIHFIETARLVSLQKADVICHISNWLAERTPAPYWINRAFENSCYVIESNRWGLERTVQFSGGSCIIGPDGTVEAVVDNGNGLAIGHIDLERARRRKVLGERVFDQRRPELYANLATNTFAWNPRDFFSLYGHRPLPPGRRSRATAAQFLPSKEPGQNLQRIEALTAAAVDRGKTDIIVFPELSVTGLSDAQSRAETISGASCERLVQIAMHHRVHIVAGIAERADGCVYNTAVLVGPNGLIGTYRKIHLSAKDADWATAGSEWKFFDTIVGRVGLLIGNDALLPEAGRALALFGCDLIACPAALAGKFTAAHDGTKVEQNYPIPTGSDTFHWHLFRVRAGENNTFVAFANVIDPQNDFHGASGVFGPDSFEFPRRESLVVSGEGVVSAEIDTTNEHAVYPTNVVRRKDLVLMRLPNHYQPLVIGSKANAAGNQANIELLPSARVAHGR
jgi:predicted amidohydrolase